MQSGPLSAAAADADVEFALGQIDERHGSIQTHRKIGMRELERAESRHEPGGGDRRQGRDREFASLRSAARANAACNCLNASSTAGADAGQRPSARPVEARAGTG